MELYQFILDASLQENYFTTFQNNEDNPPNQKWSPKKERASFSARMFRPWRGCLHVGQLLTWYDHIDHHYDFDDDHEGTVGTSSQSSVDAIANI